VFHAIGEKHAGTDEPFLSGRHRVSGLDPGRGSYRSYASFNDPDGNGWLFQEITSRLPGRVQGKTTFTSSTDLAGALRRAAAAHEAHQKQPGDHEEKWPDWYADYIIREQTEGSSPS
jgi:hypothetical protein